MPAAFLTGFVQSTTTGGTFTTSAINTSGAALIVVGISSYALEPPATLTDSKGNTWTAIGSTVTFDNIAVQYFYAQNPAAGAGHTFTVTAPSAFPSIGVAAFSTTLPGTGTLDGTASASASTATIQPGSVTPSGNDRVLVTVLAHWLGTVSIDSGFTIAGQTSYLGGFHFGFAIAWKIQTAAGAENPTWTVGAASGKIARQAAFLTGSGAAAGQLDVTKILLAAVGSAQSPDALAATKIVVAAALGASDRIEVMKILGAVLLAPGTATVRFALFEVCEANA